VSGWAGACRDARLRTFPPGRATTPAQHRAGSQDGREWGMSARRADGLGSQEWSSSARTSCTLATTPRTRAVSSTKRSPGSCGNRGSGYRRAARAQGRAGGGRSTPCSSSRGRRRRDRPAGRRPVRKPVHGGAEAKRSSLRTLRTSLSGTVMDSLAGMSTTASVRPRSDRSGLRPQRTACGRRAMPQATGTAHSAEDGIPPVAVSIRASRQLLLDQDSGRSPRPAGRTRGISQERIGLSSSSDPAFRLGIEQRRGLVVELGTASRSRLSS